MQVPSEEIENYLSIPVSGGADFNPQKNEIAFISNETGVYQVFTKNLDTGDIQQISQDENRCTNPVYLPNGDLIYLTDFGGNECFQIMVYSNGTTYRLTTFLETKHRFQFSTDNAVYFSANLLDSQRFDVFRYQFPLEEGMKEELLMEGEPSIPLSPSLVNSEENILVVNRVKGNLSNDLIFHYFDSSKSVNVTEQYFEDHNTRFDAIEFLSEQKLLIKTDHGREFLSLAIFELDTGKINFLESDEWDTGRVWLSDDKDKIVYSKNIKGSHKLISAAFNNSIDGKKEIPLPHHLGVLSSGDFRTFTRSFVVNKDGTKLLCSFTSPITPQSVYLVDLETSKITGINSPTIDFEHDFRDLSVSGFKSFDGLEVPYFIHYPNGEGPFPTVFVIHGGPEAQAMTAFSNVAQLLLSQKYIVIFPNIRGSSGYGRTYLSLDDIEKRLDSIKDINALVNYVVANDPKVDKNKLVIYGGSYGGFAVLSSITEFPDLFHTAIDVVGISNFVSFLKNTADWRRRIREVEYGFLDRDLEFLESVSPSNKVDLIKTPTLIVQGDNDERVPLSESIQMYEELQRRNIPSKLLRFEDEGHGVVKRKNQIIEYQAIFSFLETHL